MPAWTASSTTYWMAGLSTTGSISLGWALVAGRKRVPSPAAGMTALVTDGFMRALYDGLAGSGLKLRSGFARRASDLTALDVGRIDRGRRRGGHQGGRRRGRCRYAGTLDCRVLRPSPAIRPCTCCSICPRPPHGGRCHAHLRVPLQRLRRRARSGPVVHRRRPRHLPELRRRRCARSSRRRASRSGDPASTRPTAAARRASTATSTDSSDSKSSSSSSDSSSSSSSSTSTSGNGSSGDAKPSSNGSSGSSDKSSSSSTSSSGSKTATPA